ncbi:ArsR/SmtB family transcription factor [Pseudonocardia benzenivorans]|uniref:Regulatory protein ArsR n=2 Tax=Pseudonocardia TaxID=1847 RepID=F4CVU6_PSEUX|nr:metalloregulator ArsR/SmtB family transcription factor [Pseudonocardia dioxanivorans]AEA25431.1 regulatory protein ArsR [Pseudonocardia dioxanivorans CB1190]GJF02400.1 hypothetical protein PSD17_13630 [Pseudonocardia sp. D17]
MDANLAFDALADPIRREILGVLAAEDECSAGAIADRITSVGRSAVSMHLKVLRVAGLVSERREGRFRFYSIDSAGSARDVLSLLHNVFRAGLQSVGGAVPDDELDGRRAVHNPGTP